MGEEWLERAPRLPPVPGYIVAKLKHPATLWFASKLVYEIMFYKGMKNIPDTRTPRLAEFTEHDGYMFTTNKPFDIIRPVGYDKEHSRLIVQYLQRVP